MSDLLRKFYFFRFSIMTLPISIMALPVLIVGMLLTMPPYDAQAGQLPSPSGKVILVITGSISNTNFEGEARFDREMLRDMGLSTLVTNTAWTDGATTFEGVLAKRIMDAVGAHGEWAIGVAHDDYKVKIPLRDFQDYPVLFALSMNDKRLTRRDKGPIWIMYPWDDFEELRTENKVSLAIWQLRKLTIE